MPDAIRILGIDPGTNITGFGLVEFSPTPHLVEAGTFRPNSKADLPQRIAQLYADLSELLDETHVDFLAVEQLYSHYAHPRTSIIMGHARGVLLLAAAQRNIPIRHLAATQIKKSLTGNGHASKRQMQLAVQSVFNLDQPPQPADVADAIAIALCAGNQM